METFMTTAWTVEEFAVMRGVSQGTMTWMTTSPDERPKLGGYVDVPPVFTSRHGFAALWAAGENAVRYQVRRRRIDLYDDRIEVHRGDIAWGMCYWDKRMERENFERWDTVQNWAMHSVELQAIERELIRRGYMPSGELVEVQLRCTALSEEWWRRNGRYLRPDRPGTESADAPAPATLERIEAELVEAEDWPTPADLSALLKEADPPTESG
jgi:hypothetical protein